MQKTPTLFLRDYEAKSRPVVPDYNPDALWLLKAVAKLRPTVVATRKFDGTACLYKDGVLYRRYDAKKVRTPPDDFVPAQDEADPVTGHRPGWVPCKRENPNDCYHFEALDSYRPSPESLTVCEPLDWTYELVGPKIQGNPECFVSHALIAHGRATYDPLPPLDFEGMREWLVGRDIEGIVWWEDPYVLDCRKVKLKLSDFGLKR